MVKAKIEEVRFGQGRIIARVSLHFSVGEAGYEASFVDVLDVSGKPTGAKRFIPFNTVPIDIGLDETPEKVHQRVVSTLRAFKEAHQAIQAAQQWVGWEHEE